MSKRELILNDSYQRINLLGEMRKHATGGSIMESKNILSSGFIIDRREVIRLAEAEEKRIAEEAERKKREAEAEAKKKSRRRRQTQS